MPNEIISTVSAVGDTFEASQTEVLLTAVATFSKGECILCVLDSDGRYTTCVAPTAASLGTVASAICSNGTFGIILEDVIGTATVRAWSGASDCPVHVGCELDPGRASRSEHEQAA